MTTAATNKAALRLRLYVVGKAPNSVSALANIRAICARHFALQHELEIVDLIEQPRRGLDDHIIVTPTLVRLRPLPAQRVIGDLSDEKQVLLCLTGA